MLTEQLIVIPLRDSRFAKGPIQFLRVETSSAPTPFARIRYAIEGEEQPLGLRLDLDKGIVLLDQDDPEIVKRAVLALRNCDSIGDSDVQAIQESIRRIVEIARAKRSRMKGDFSGRARSPKRGSSSMSESKAVIG